MRRLVVTEFLSLDGVMQAPGLPDEDRSGGFDLGGWQQPYADGFADSELLAALAVSDAMLLGRRTYEIFAAYWPKAPADDPMARVLNGLTKYVVSTTLREPLDWHESHVISGDVPTELARLKQAAGKDIAVSGSGELAQTLIEHDLVDEYRLLFVPVVLGTGKRLFRDGNALRTLRLVDSKRSSTGVLIATYAAGR